MSKTILSGTVISKTDKTVKVVITRYLSHKLYKKPIKVSKKYLAHDQDNKCSVGDNISIIESRPISKRKRWTVYNSNS
ncbi:MAG: 30S ribosomal protein S17 [Cyanobacteria bacterium P01_A01_bin.68]